MDVSEIAGTGLSDIGRLGEGRLTVRGDVVAFVTDPRQWAYSAQTEVEVPDVSDDSFVVRIRVVVERGVLGAGLLTEDGSAWMTRTSATAGPAVKELRLRIPPGARRSRLVFDNWTEGGEAACGDILGIDVVVDESVRHFRSGVADEARGDRNAAVAHYKSVLAADPAHVQARASLGRLRLVPPDQPFISEVSRQAPVDVCAVIIQVRNPCNYRCFYCVGAGHNDDPVQWFDLARVDRAYGQIHTKLVTTTFDCGGGEPTIHPQFRELLQICSTHGAVDIPSNNSQDPERWLPKDTARRISIRSAVHPESELKLDRYLKHARYLIDAGSQFSSVFIAHPLRIEKIPQYRELFQKLGVRFHPVSFIGTYNGKSYPHAYTEEEKRLIGLEVETRLWLHKIEPHTTRIRNFRGIPCIAGHRYIYITKDGDFRRCIYDPDRALAAPLETPEPCGVNRCGCGMWLEKLNFVQNVKYYNIFAEMAGLDAIPTEWTESFAHELGYPGGSEDAMATESMKMYDALMAAYGKDEFPE